MNNTIQLRIFFTFILFSLSLMGVAQGTRFSAGIEGGPSIICLNNDQFFEDPGIGFSTGMYIQYNAKKVFSIKLAPSFERKGEWSTNNYHKNLNYIVVPLLSRIEIGSEIRGFFSAGPYFGYLMEAYTTADYYEGHKNYMEYLNRFDAGISAGFGVNIPIEQMFSISIELRNNIGLYQIVTKEQSEEYHWYWHTYSTNLLFSVAYNFNKRKSK